jgi:hypothetical protein
MNHRSESCVELSTVVCLCLAAPPMIRKLLPRRLSKPPHRPISTTSRLTIDPWPLPNTPEHLASTTIQEDHTPAPVPRPNESANTLRARLVYQSRKRGTLESDLLLSTFAQEHLGTMTEAELREYDKVPSLHPFPSLLNHANLWFLPCVGPVDSCSTSRIGTSTIGRRVNDLRRPGGQARPCLRSLQCTRGTKARRCGACPHCRSIEEEHGMERSGVNDHIMITFPHHVMMHYFPALR